MLADLLYSTVKLRLPEDDIINGCIENISIRLRKGQPVALKNLALIIWSCARIKMPDQELPKLLNERSNLLMHTCIRNQFLFDWTQRRDQM